MKKILLALTMAGLVHFSADAKNCKHTTAANTKHSRFDQNYKVCKSSDGYAICGTGMTASTMNPGTNAIDNANSNPFSMEMNRTNAYEGYYKQHNIVVNDDMNAPYEGLPSRQNDGVQTNEVRNINVNQTQILLPANDGSMPK